MPSKVISANSRVPGSAPVFFRLKQSAARLSCIAVRGRRQSGNHLLANTDEPLSGAGEKWELMPPNLRERQVQAAARRIGLKLIGLKRIVDRCNADETARKGYYLRPISDARHVVRVLPSGGYEMAMSTRGRRHVATPLTLDDIELLIGGWGEPVGVDRQRVLDE
jgi:hypothetical protein